MSKSDLGIFVRNEQLIVHDGCPNVSVDSNIQAIRRNDRLMGKQALSSTRAIDHAFRLGSQQAGILKGIYQTSIGVAHVFYERNMELEIACPECGDTYFLGRKELQAAEDQYREANTQRA